MISGNTNELKAPVRHISAKAELLHNSSAQAVKTGFQKLRINDSVKYAAPIEMKVTSKNLFDDVAFFQANGFVLQEDGTWYGTQKNKVIFTNTDARTGPITISAYGKRMAQSIVFMIKYTDGTTAYSTTIPYNEFGSFSYTTDKNKIVNTITWIHQYAGDYYIKDVQIEYGAEATDYATFQNPVGAELVRWGKNMFEHSTLTFTGSPEIALTNPIPPGYYVFSVENCETTATQEKCALAFYGESGVVYTVSMPKNDSYYVAFTAKESIVKIIAYASTSWYNAQNQTATFTNMMLCDYNLYTLDECRQFEPFAVPQRATVGESGVVEGFTNLYPNNTITESNKKNVTIFATYFIPEGEDAVLTNENDLMSISVDRVGESKMFGYGISQKANIKIRDIERGYVPSTKNFIKLSFNDVCSLPIFYVTEVHRLENTNELSITCYDRLNEAATHTVSELGLDSYTIGEFAVACGELLGLNVIVPDFAEFALHYEEGANFEGTETIREALNDVAEATQTIYYIDNTNALVFKRLDVNGEPVETITKEDYIKLDSKTNRRLTGICHATELGDNVEATMDISGTMVYIRDNAFWEMRDDIDELVNNALSNTQQLTINQFDCTWRGNYFIEPGDKIGLVAKDGSIVHSYLLNDTIDYNGSFSQKSEWTYAEDEATAANPSSLGETLKQTYAKVDKANKQVDIVVSEVGSLSDDLTALVLNTESITATVSGVASQVDDMGNKIGDMQKKVESTMTDEEIRFAITQGLNDGTSQVRTATGFVFDEHGLNISKESTQFSTTITDNGMTIDNKGSNVLVANDEGVQAIDLHATTFLIIGNNSRFEDMGNRTACFWLGG